MTSEISETIAICPRRSPITEKYGEGKEVRPTGLKKFTYHGQLKQSRFPLGLTFVPLDGSSRNKGSWLSAETTYMYILYDDVASSGPIADDHVRFFADKTLWNESDGRIFSSGHSFS